MACQYPVASLPIAIRCLMSGPGLMARRCTYVCVLIAPSGYTQDVSPISSDELLSDGTLKISFLLPWMKEYGSSANGLNKTSGPTGSGKLFLLAIATLRSV